MHDGHKPAARALETADIIATKLSGLQETLTDNRVSEIDFGKWDGLTYDEIDAGWPGARNAGASGEWYFKSPDGESFETFWDRLASVLSAVTRDLRHHKIIVSHGLAGRVLRGIHASLSKAKTISLPAPEKAFFVLQNDGGIEEVEVE